MFPVRKCNQHFASLFLFFMGILPLHFCRSCTWSFRKGKNMKIGKRHCLKESECLFKVGICFAGESYDNICTCTGKWHKFSYHFHPSCKEFPFVPPSHKGKDPVASALKWNVEMGKDLFIASAKFYQLICKKVWLYG